MFGAGNEARTRDLNLGKVALYQLSYSRICKTQIIHRLSLFPELTRFNLNFSGGAGRSRTDLHGFAIRCITALLPRPIFRTQALKIPTKKGSSCFPFWLKDVGTSFNVWSGKRGSNSRPQPWQGCALPTELFPRISEFSIICFVRCNERIIARFPGYFETPRKFCINVSPHRPWAWQRQP